LKRGIDLGKTSTATKNKWNAQKYDQLRINVYKGQREQIKAYAEEQGLSINGYINKLIADDMGGKLKRIKDDTD